MCELDISLSKIWERKISVFAILLLFLLLGAAYIEFQGIINIIDNNETPPYEIDTVAQFIGAVGSILLTVGLVILYDKQASVSKQQTSIQENQERLMQAEYEPKLKASVGFKDIQSLQFEIHNTGKAAAHDVRLRWSYGEQQFSWSKSVIPSGEMTGFPLKDENADWLLGPDETRDFFDELDDSNISYEVNCQDILNNSHEFDGDIDVVDVIDSRTNPAEFANNDDMTDELSNINSTLEQIQREIKPSPLEKMKRMGSVPPEESEGEETDSNED